MLKNIKIVTNLIVILGVSSAVANFSFPIGYLKATWQGGKGGEVEISGSEPYEITVKPSGPGSLIIRPVTRTPQPNPIRIDSIKINGDVKNISIKFPKPTKELLIDWQTNPLANISFVGSISASSCKKITISGGNLGHSFYSENNVKIDGGKVSIKTIANKIKYDGIKHYYGGDIFASIEIPNESELKLLAKGGSIYSYIINALKIKTIAAMGVKNYDLDGNTILKGGNIQNSIISSVGSNEVLDAASGSSNHVFSIGELGKLYASGGKIYKNYILIGSVKSISSKAIKLDDNNYSEAGIDRIWLLSPGGFFKQAHVKKIQVKGANINNAMIQVRDDIFNISAKKYKLSNDSYLGGKILDANIICGTVGATNVNIPPDIIVDRNWTYFKNDVINENVKINDSNGNSFKLFLADNLSFFLNNIIFPTNILFSNPIETQFIADAVKPGNYTIDMEAEDDGSPKGFYIVSVKYRCYDNQRPSITTDVSTVSTTLGGQIKIKVTGTDPDNDNVRYSYSTSQSGILEGNVDFDTNSVVSGTAKEFNGNTAKVGAYELYFYATDNGTPNAPVMEPCVVKLNVTDSLKKPIPFKKNKIKKDDDSDSQGNPLPWWGIEGHYHGQLNSISADDEMKRISVRVGVPDSKIKRIKTTGKTSRCVFESYSDIPISMLDGSSKDVLADPALSNIFIPGFK